MFSGIIALLAGFFKAFPALLGFIERVAQAAREAEADRRLAEKNARISDAIRNAVRLRDDAKAEQRRHADGEARLPAGSGDNTIVGSGSVGNDSKT